MNIKKQCKQCGSNIEGNEDEMRLLYTNDKKEGFFKCPMCGHHEQFNIFIPWFMQRDGDKI